MYPEVAKAKKQLKYADQRGFSYVAMLGDDELASNTVLLKTLDEGSQRSLPFEDLLTLLKG